MHEVVLTIGILATSGGANFLSRAINQLEKKLQTLWKGESIGDLDGADWLIQFWKHIFERLVRKLDNKEVR